MTVFGGGDGEAAFTKGFNFSEWQPSTLFQTDAEAVAVWSMMQTRRGNPQVPPGPP